MLYPVNLVVEGHLYAGWPKSRKRQMFKNLNRAVTVIFTIVLALYIWEKLDLFLSVTGALFCTPIAFIFPALFHYKACAETTAQKVVDLSIVTVATIIMIYCTYSGIRAMVA